MAYFSKKNVKVSGIVAAVPSKIVDNHDGCSGLNDDSKLFLDECGIRYRRISYTLTGLDLCYEATEKLLDLIGWERSEIEGIIVATSYPDYVLPNNACILQAKLGLSNTCYAHDIAMEASGWIHALSTAASLVQNGCLKKVIICTGVGRLSYDDNCYDALYGHAATATAVEYNPNSSELLSFHFGTIDKLGDNRIIQNGMRESRTYSSLCNKYDLVSNQCKIETYIDKDQLKKEYELYLNKAIDSIGEIYKLSVDNIDNIILNPFYKELVSALFREKQISLNKLETCVRDYGNVGSSTIPLSLIGILNRNLLPNVSVYCFGGGDLSYGSVLLNLKHNIVSDIVEL